MSLQVPTAPQRNRGREREGEGEGGRHSEQNVRSHARGDGGILEVGGDLSASPSVLQLLAASACRGQFSSSMPES